MKIPALLKRLASTTALRLVLAIFAGWLLHGIFAPPAAEPVEVSAPAPGAEEAQPAFWTCSMHPQVRSEGPGPCPICGMDLIPAAAGGNDLGPTQLRMSPHALELASVRTVAVERRAISREVRLTARVAADETRVAEISNWMPGRLERLFITATGVFVPANSHVAEIYNPDLLALERELIDADLAVAALDEQASEDRRDIADSRLASARQALLELGLAQIEIDAVLEDGVPRERYTIYSPTGGIVTHKLALEGRFVHTGTHLYTIADLSKVWVEMDAYEADLAWLRFGQSVSFTTVAHPGRDFSGRIASVDPVLDPRTRTARVRVNVENPDLLLMPGMFVQATVQSNLTATGRSIEPDLLGMWMCPMHPEIVEPAPGPCPECGMDLVAVEDLGFATTTDDELPLVIPASAALVTGRRAVVYVRLPAEEDKDPVFEGRQIRLGPRAGDSYVVFDGLSEGEQVVMSGAFRVDSELQLQAKRSMMSADEAAPSAERVAAPRAVRRALGGALVLAVDVATSLATDDLVSARAAAESLHMDLMQTDLSALGGEDRRRAQELVDAGMRSALLVAGAEDIESGRAEFEHLQTALLAIAQILGYETEDVRTVSIFHCPMAFDGRGADWLQWSGTPTENPYFGSSMFRCGEEVTVVLGGAED